MLARNWVVLAACVGGLALAGCGSSAESLCDDICDCVGCSENEYDECVDEIDDVGRAAENEGCEDQYDDALACNQDEFRCDGDRVDIDGCGSEERRLAECLD
jgi:hypothetical protein